MGRSKLNYFKAVGWFLLSLTISCSNDVLTKHIGTRLGPWQVAFFRCLFGTATLLPLLLSHGRAAFKTCRPVLHALRGGLLFMALGLWCCGVQAAPITTATIMSFTVPIFVLLLSPLLLQERVTARLWLATLVGFLGVVCILQPSSSTFPAAAGAFGLAAGLFGLLDVINKKYVTQESVLALLFYSTLVAALLLALPAMWASTVPTVCELGWLLVLGLGSNLILYCLLRAFALASVAALAPFRYLELLLAVLAGYWFFAEVPGRHFYLGAALIIPSTLFIVHSAARSR